MQRINSVTARANLNGPNKTGFHDNADLSGQDATYLTPEWCNHVQEEISNAIEVFEPLEDRKDQLALILQKIKNNINILENSFDKFKQEVVSNIQDISIGGIFLTMNHFENGEAVALHKGYGRWERLGNGQALVTLGDDTRPEFMRTIGHSGGEDMHQLTIDEIPEHYHRYNGDDQYVNKDIFGDDAAIRERDIPYDAISDFTSSIGGVYRTSTVGKTQFHNNVQQSLTVGAWKRLPDFDSVFKLTSNKNKVYENDEIIFTLNTKNEPKGAQYYFDVNGLDPESYSLSSKSFSTDDNFTAQVKIRVKNLNTQLHNRKLTIVLKNGKGAIGIEKDILPIKYTRLFLDQLPTIKTEEDVIQVKDNVNLYRFFVQNEKRKPTPNENITFVIPENIAIVGKTVNTPAIDIGEFTTQIINIENNGFILGRGGTSDWANDKKRRTTGGNALRNTNKSNINIINKNWIAGGGGAGGVGAERASGAGAPYGTTATTTVVNRAQVTATFKTPGQRNIGQGKLAKHGAYNGAGGAWGESGENGYGHFGYENIDKGLQAGLAFDGNFNVIENTGIIKGRDKKS